MENKLSFQQLNLNWEDFVTGDATADSLIPYQEDIFSVLAVGEEIVYPQVSIQLFDVDMLTSDSFTLQGHEFRCGKKIISQLKNSEMIAVFVCTIGKGVTEQYKRFTEENEPLKAYFADMLGSIAVEKAMDIFQQQLLEKLLQTKGYAISNRYSPGYCGWLLKEQIKLFELMGDNTCDIRLTDSCLMLPAKSISGVIGIGKKVRFMNHECHLCSLDKCIYRKHS